MNNKQYLLTSVLHFGKPVKFIESAVNMKWRYVILHFMFIFTLLFIPVFSLMVRTYPHELYQRLYSVDFSSSSFIDHSNELFAVDFILDNTTAIYFFNDKIVYADHSLLLTMPVEFIDSDNLYYSFDDYFNMISVYNLYVAQFLLPFISLAMLVVLIIHIFFISVLTVFLGFFRLGTHRFTYGERTKIIIMSSLPICIISTIAGFLIPAVHIILFQILNLILVFYLSRRYDFTQRRLIEGVI